MRAAFLALLLTACTTTSVEALDDRTMIISGSGTAFDRMSSVSRAILVRAATEAQRRGFSHFVISGVQDTSSVGTYTTPTTTNAYGSATCSGYTCYGSGTATTTGGQTFQFDRPGADATIYFLRVDELQGMKGGLRVWEAASVLAANPSD